MMGRISACTPLIGWNGPTPDSIYRKKSSSGNGQLSQGQQAASNRVVEAVGNMTNCSFGRFVVRGKRKSCLLELKRHLLPIKEFASQLREQM